MGFRLVFLRTIVACASAAILGITLGGCATPGLPLPPSLQIPKPVDDLAAVRNGNKVVLSWTGPVEATDGTNIRKPGITRICRSQDNPDAGTCREIGEVRSLTGAPQQYTDTLEGQMAERTGLVLYDIEALNAKGQMYHASNMAVIPTAPTLPPPDFLRLENTKSGVALRWSSPSQAPREGLEFGYRILRKEENAASWQDLGLVPAKNAELSFTDTTTEFGRVYQYALIPVSRFSREGAPYEVQGTRSAPSGIAVNDIFPPSPPDGLQAISAGIPGETAIDLSWHSVKEIDLAGYNVYRRGETGPPLRVNRELAVEPAYRDTTAALGERYYYSVTAVDLKGNESNRSQEASETASAAPQ